MTVREFLRVMWEGKYFIVLSVMVALGGSVLYADRQPEAYEASAVVQINAADTGEDPALAASSTVDTDPRLVEAPEVLRTVGGDSATRASLRGLASRISGLYDEETRVTVITTVADSPQGAVTLANTVASAYVEHLPSVIDGQIEEVETRRDALRTQLDTVAAQLKENKKDPLAIAERETIITQYQALSASRNTLDSILTPAQILTPASSAAVMGLPRLGIVLIGGLAGIAIGIGLSLARRALDSRLRGRIDTTDAAGAPVLAELYEVKRAAKSYRKVPVLPVSSRVASPFTESIRELRTALHVALHDNEHAVVVVTAADPHAARSFITANLAASWAMSGRKTVAVAGDLRGRGLGPLLPPPHGPGSDREGLRETQVPSLGFLTLQDPDMDPADFLATAQVRRIIESARDAADVLVIDAPPVLGAADATILGGYADCVVLVATAGRTDRGVLQAAVDRLRINDAPLAGIALAGVKSDSQLIYASTYGEATAPGRPEAPAAGVPVAAEAAAGPAGLAAREDGDPGSPEVTAPGSAPAGGRRPTARELRVSRWR
ncbi:polysaccharide biosynthesis tyrosine autokinase [Isoptericola croceus]|uniref:polysaccharide biosynthesis tyrosine autokinase n=1 Tax=Isoptericola croceus TaxID=3031406 RepID=UPI0023F91617|nr:polysaccharide biosynthesis tyrosine autokinase [Isoptericola croceus]